MSSLCLEKKNTQYLWTSVNKQHHNVYILEYVNNTSPSINLGGRFINRSNIARWYIQLACHCKILVVLQTYSLFPLVQNKISPQLNFNANIHPKSSFNRIKQPCLPLSHRYGDSTHPYQPIAIQMGKIKKSFKKVKTSPNVTYF